MGELPENEKFAVVLPALTAEIEDALRDGKAITICLETQHSAVAANVSPVQAAQMSLKLLDWVSRATGHADKSITMRPAIAQGLFFDAGPDEDTLVLCVDLGAATARFEVTHAHVVAAFGQLRPTRKPPSGRA